MFGVNRVHLIGIAGGKPVLRKVGENRVARFSLAVDEPTRNGTHTEWIRIEAWGAVADAIKNLVDKGARLYVEGSLRQSSWTDREGRRQRSIVVRSRLIIRLNGKPATPAASEEDNSDVFA